MTTLINKESTQHYANKMVLAENRKVGNKSLPTALNEIDALIDEMKTYFDAEYGSALDMKLENNENIFSVGTGTNVDKRSEVENSFTDVELSGNSLVNLIQEKSYLDWHVLYCGRKSSEGIFIGRGFKYSSQASPNITTSTDVRCKIVSKNNSSYTLIFDATVLEGTSSEFTIVYNGICIRNTAKIKNGRNVLLIQSDESQNGTFQIYDVSGNNNEGDINIRLTNIVILEGDWTNKPIPQYFQGLKSVGEKTDGNHKFSIASFNNGNVIVNPTYKTGFYVSLNNGVEQINNDYSCTDFIRIESNKKIRVINTNFNIAFYNKDKKNIPIKVQDLSGNNTDFTTITPKESYYVRFSTANNAIGTEGCFYGDNIGDINTEIRIDKKEISLNEPLRGLPNGVKDTIEKINGEWKIVRRCGEVVVDGTDYVVHDFPPSQNSTIAFAVKQGTHSNTDNAPILNDKFINVLGDNYWNEDKECLMSASGKHFKFRILRSKLETEDEAGFKKWLSQNPTKIIYELTTPIIEDISPVTLQCWKNGTIFIDEVLPVETNHTVALNKSAQIKNNIKELTTLRKRVEDLESFYDKIALEQAYQLDLVNHSYELDYNR